MTVTCLLYLPSKNQKANPILPLGPRRPPFRNTIALTDTKDVFLIINESLKEPDRPVTPDEESVFVVDMDTDQ